MTGVSLARVADGAGTRVILVDNSEFDAQDVTAVPADLDAKSAGPQQWNMGCPPRSATSTIGASDGG